jgi:hypothetical protein
MKPTEQGQRCQGLLEAMQKRLVMCMQSPRLAAATTIILPPRLIAGR